MLAIQLLLLDVFRLLIETNTGTGLYVGREKIISFDRKGSVHWSLIMETLMQLILSNEESLGSDINRSLSDPQKLAKLDWTNNPNVSVSFICPTHFRGF